MKKTILLFLATFIISASLKSQISAKLMRFMDISQDKIAFVYGGDIWLVEKEGGQAYQLTNSPMEESWPRFSPDGSEIAYTASYQGNMDVYVISVNGGMPHSKGWW